MIDWERHRNPFTYVGSLARAGFLKGRGQDRARRLSQALLDFRFWLVTKLAGQHIAGVNLRIRGGLIMVDGDRQAFLANYARLSIWN